MLTIEVIVVFNRNSGDIFDLKVSERASKTSTHTYTIFNLTCYLSFCFIVNYKNFQFNFQMKSVTANVMVCFPIYVFLK